MNNSLAMRPAWTPLNVVLMVAGFVIFWPLGLAMLAYILWGPQIRDGFEEMRRQFHRQTAHGRGCHYRETGNIAFDDYRKRELERLEEERRRLDRERAEFEEFVRNLRRAKDQEEFDRFMAERDRSQNGRPTGPSV
jgi:hypothetical protein